MPLTPADVHNVAFSKPPIGKRGYNEDEVDAFLDLVENELTRLIEENSRPASAGRRAGPGGGSAARRRGQCPADADDSSLPDAGARTRTGPSPSTRRRPRLRSPSAPTEDPHLRAAKVLGLAQDTADRLTGTRQGRVRQDARRRTRPGRRDGQRGPADRRDHRVRGKQRADAMLADAQTRSETQLRQAQEKADALQADAERKHSEIMGTINQQRTVLEGRLEQLRTFEREYRTRLKTYLESQLEELGQRGSAAPVDSSANNERRVQPVQPGQQLVTCTSVQGLIHADRCARPRRHRPRGAGDGRRHQQRADRLGVHRRQRDRRAAADRRRAAGSVPRRGRTADEMAEEGTDVVRSTRTTRRKRPSPKILRTIRSRMSAPTSNPIATTATTTRQPPNRTSTGSRQPTTERRAEPLRSTVFDGGSALVGGCGEQVAHFVVGDLMEILEHLTDGSEIRRHRRAHHVVGLVASSPAHRRRPDGHRHDDRAAAGSARTARTAAIMLAPVAMPSSTSDHGPARRSVQRAARSPR